VIPLPLPLSNPVPVREARGQRAVTAPDREPPTLAPGAAAVVAGLGDWWAARAAAAGLSGSWLDVRTAVAAQEPDLAVRVTPATVKGTAEDVGMAYVTGLAASDRSKNGRHYTPAPLAGQLWAMTKRALGQKRPQPLAGRVVDPACGAGALLLPILREHLGTVARVDAQLALAALPNQMMGVDNDPVAVWVANVVLASEMLPILARTERARRRPLPALVRHGDGLAAVDEPVRVTIMNPPYGRVRLDEAERARFARTLYGHANLYGLFLAAALESLDQDGVLAALVPTSFLAGRYFENLRAELGRVAPLHEIQFVADRSGSFTGVLQETCMATFRRRRTRRTTVGRIGASTSSVATLAVPRTSGPWLLPRRADDAPVAAAATTMPETLASVGWKVSTGPLVWNRRKNDLGSKPGSGRLPVLWAVDIDGGAVHRDPARDSLRYLTLGAKDADVLVLDQPCVLVQRTTAPEQQRRLNAAQLTPAALTEWGGRIVVENHVNLLRSTTTTPALSADLLTRLLATSTIDRLLRCLSGSVAVSAYELEALPLPARESLQRWESATAEELEHLVAEAYRPETL